MTIDTMKVLKADTGMRLTDGKVYGRVFILPDDRATTEFHEITEEEYEDILKEQEEVPHDDNI